MKKSLSIVIMFAIILTSLFITACTPSGNGGYSPNDQIEDEIPIEDEEASPGLLYINLGDGTYAIAASDEAKELTDIVIPSTYEGKPVTVIYNGAFEGSTTIKTVKLPETIVEIDDAAFRGCFRLESINIPDSVQRIGNEAFKECGITSINIPDGVRVIGFRTFYACPLTSVTIPDSVTVIHPYAFYHCASLKKVIIPEGVTELGDYAFARCAALRVVYLPSTLEKSGYLTLGNLGSLETVHYAGTPEQFAKIEGNDDLDRSWDLIYNSSP